MLWAIWGLGWLLNKDGDTEARFGVALMDFALLHMERRIAARGGR